jgi:hypothetical protein
MSDTVNFTLDEIVDKGIPRQDPNDQVWVSELNDFKTDNRQGEYGSDVGGEPVRTNSGVLDLLHAVEEDISGWMHRETVHGEAHRTRGVASKPHLIPAVPACAKSWRGVTYNVDAEKKIVTAREDRSSVTVTNYGPGILYLSHETVTGSTVPQQNMVQVPPPGPDATITGRSNSRTFHTQGEIWASPAIIGTGQVVDVQDEYGF